MEILVGIIKWFDFEKGFGVIETPNCGEFFIHKSNLRFELKDLYLQAPMVFSADFENDKKTAKKCHFPKDADDLYVILQLINNNRVIKIHVKKELRNRSGSSYISKELMSFDMLDICLTHMLKTKNQDRLFSLITSSYLSIIESDKDFDYNSYFELITKKINERNTDSNNELLQELYRFYDSNINEEVLFAVWKIKNFHFIDKTEFEDYEIPSFVLINNYDKLTLSDLNRIKDYENGGEICVAVVEQKLNSLNSKSTIEELIESYKLLPFVKNEGGNKKLKTFLNQLLYEKVSELLKTKLFELPSIDNKSILSKYEALRGLVPEEIDENQNIKLSNIIDKGIKSNTADSMLIHLWLMNYEVAIDASQIVEFLNNENTDIQDKLSVLSKIHEYDNIESILIHLISKESIKSYFELLEKFIRKENSLPYSFKLSSDLKNGELQKDLIGLNLFRTFQSVLVQITDENEQSQLFLEGYLERCSEDYFLGIVENLDLEQIRIILSNSNTDLDYSFRLLEKRSKTVAELETEEFLNLSKQFLQLEQQGIIDDLLLRYLSNERWFELWKSRATKTLRKEYILELFNETEIVYIEITSWIKDDVISRQGIFDLLLMKLESLDSIKDRIDFYTSFNIIKKLVEIDLKFKDNVLLLDNKFYSLILWHLGFSESFDFAALKGKFIYFKPNDQVYIFKRLFHLKHTGSLEFTFDELDEIVRADTDLYLINEKFKNDFVIDISTHILLEAIKSYQIKNTFLFESDLILKDLKNNSGRKFKIENYFEKCPGRYVSEHNWRTNGEIKRLAYTVNEQRQELFKIEFDYDKDIVDGVKKITGRRYNAREKLWLVPASYENEVLEFAKDFTFFINLPDGMHFSNNLHLANFKRAEIPKGITFCEGRKANKKHNKLKCDFWWCKNQECFQFAEVDHLSEEFKLIDRENSKVWEAYTLLDMLRILNINTDEYKEVTEETIVDGHYYKFLGHINAFNRLLEKLYCSSCDELLYPTESSNFGLHRNSRFHCENDSCHKHREVIYLNTCLYGECNSIIDSRISKTCSHGLYICENCGSCCSHSMFQRRLDNLKLVGRSVNPKLIYNVENKKGHLEKAEYYCYQCSGMMTQKSKSNYECKNCKVQYDLTKFKWLDRKWTSVAQRREDYPIG